MKWICFPVGTWGLNHVWLHSTYTYLKVNEGPFSLKKWDGTNTKLFSLFCGTTRTNYREWDPLVLITYTYVVLTRNFFFFFLGRKSSLEIKVSKNRRLIKMMRWGPLNYFLNWFLVQLINLYLRLLLRMLSHPHLKPFTNGQRNSPCLKVVKHIQLYCKLQNNFNDFKSKYGNNILFF